MRKDLLSRIILPVSLCLQFVGFWILLGPGDADHGPRFSMLVLLSILGVQAPAYLSLFWLRTDLKSLARLPKSYRITFVLIIVLAVAAPGVYSLFQNALANPWTKAVGVMSLIGTILILECLLLIWLSRPSPRPVLSRVAGVVDVILFNMALLALLIELSARFAVHLAPNSTLAYRERSNATALEEVNEQLEKVREIMHLYKVPFNSLGFPDTEFEVPKPKDVYRIVALSDSFGIISNVPHEFHHLRVLENELAELLPDRTIEVCNLALNGMAPEHYLVALEHWGIHLDPDLVIVYFFLGNDFKPRGLENNFASTYDLFVSYRLIRRLVRIARVESTLGEAGPIQNRLHKQVPDYVKDWRLEEPYFPRDKFISIERSRGRQFLPPIQDSYYAPAVEHVLAIADLAERVTGNSLIVVLIPDEVQVNEALRQEIEATFAQRLVIEKPARYLHSRLDDKGITIIDLLDVLQEGEKSLGRVYHLQNTHWNANGNRVAAQEVARQLRDYIPKMSEH